MKALTIPKLQLQAALLSAGLRNDIQQALTLEKEKIFMWTDSTTANDSTTNSSTNESLDSSRAWTVSCITFRKAQKWHLTSLDSGNRRDFRVDRQYHDTAVVTFPQNATGCRRKPCRRNTGTYNCRRMIQVQSADNPVDIGIGGFSSKALLEICWLKWQSFLKPPLQKLSSGRGIAHARNFCALQPICCAFCRRVACTRLITVHRQAILLLVVESGKQKLRKSPGIQDKISFWC